MLKLKEKRRLRKLLYSKPVILTLVVILVLLIKPVWNAYQKYSESKEAYIATQEQLENLEKRRADLIRETERLETQRGQKEEVIEKFDVAREGEHAVIIVDSVEDSREDPEEEDTSFLSSFRRWLGDFF